MLEHKHESQEEMHPVVFQDALTGVYDVTFQELSLQAPAEVIADARPAIPQWPLNR